MRASFIALALLQGLALADYAAQVAHALFARQLRELHCSALGEKDCGAGCIPLSYTCCPSRAGGCPATAYCDLAPNGQYGCCALGRTCGGNGGVDVRPGRTFTSVATIFSATAYASTSATTVTNLETIPTFAPVTTPVAPAPSTVAPSVVVPTTTPAAPVAPTYNTTVPVAPTSNATVPSPPSPSVSLLTGGSGPSFGGFSKLQLGISAIGQLVAAWIFL